MSKEMVQSKHSSNPTYVIKVPCHFLFGKSCSLDWNIFSSLVRSQSILQNHKSSRNVNKYNCISACGCYIWSHPTASIEMLKCFIIKYHHDWTHQVHHFEIHNLCQIISYIIHQYNSFASSDVFTCV